jgi:flagella basal body P-ring formation protein FlgA
MIRIVIAVAMLVSLGREANSEPAAPRLKELVAVSAEIVRIGDLVEHAGAAAGIPVFRAPDLGQTGTVQVSRIAEALRPHDVAGLDPGGLTEVVVTRLSRAITGKDIAERIARAFAGQYGYGEARNLSVIVDRDIRLMHVESTVTADFAASRINVEPRTGRFDIAFELPGSAVARRLPLRFTGTVTETVEAATLSRSIRTGEIIKASDVRLERRPKAETAGDGIGPEQAVGLAAKIPLRGGQVLRNADLMKPQVVQRNEAVTIFYEVPGIMLTVRGKALEAGAVGDIVGVHNVQSNRTVQATVSAPGRVIIAAAWPLIAAAAAPATDEIEPRRTQ